MPDITVKRADEMERSFGGAFILARASLGVSAFGMQVFDLPPGWEGPQHAHEGMVGESAETANDGQEEVHFGLDGQTVLLVGGDEVAIDPGVMVRSGPAQMRQLATRDSPAKVLVVGAVAGRGYRAPGFTELPTT